MLVDRLHSLPRARQQIVLAYLTTSVLARTLRLGGPEEAGATRDCLVDLRPLATASIRAQIDGLLLDAVARDLRTGHDGPRRYSRLHILRTIGPPATGFLLEMLGSPPAQLYRVAALLAELAGPSDRERVGEALVARAETIESNPAALWQALGRTGGRAATRFLSGIVEGRAHPDAPFAARALRQGRPEPALVPLALRLAGDRRTSDSLREELFLLLVEIGTPEAQAGVLRFVSRARTPAFRQRAFVAALRMGGTRTLAPALEALPADHPDSRQAIEFYVEQVGRLGPAARPALLELTRSNNRIARLAATLALRRLEPPAAAPPALGMLH